MSAELAAQLANLRRLADQILSADSLFLDTETTGNRNVEVIELSLVDRDGRVIFDRLIKSEEPSNYYARQCHGIDEAMLAEAPGWRAVEDEVLDLIAGRHLVAHNAAYDRAALTATLRRHVPEGGVLSFLPAEGEGHGRLGAAGWHCTMGLLKGANGGRNPKLADAMALVGANTDGMSTLGRAHRALWDAECVRRIVLAVSQQAKPASASAPRQASRFPLS